MPAGLRVFVTSFAYRHGLPRDADLVFDVRFLENPHYVDELRRLTGCDPAVAAHIESGRGFRPVFRSAVAPAAPAAAALRDEGKSYLTIAIGCTGGRHRSVYVAERLAARLREAGMAHASWRTAICRCPPPDAPCRRRGRRRGLSRSRRSRGNR